MSRTLGSWDEATGIPDFPMTSPVSCPFDLPTQLRAAQRETRLMRVRLWDGSTPWVVTAMPTSGRC